MHPILRKTVFFVSFAAALSAMTWGAYLLTARFLKDRQAAVARLTRPERPQLARAAADQRRPGTQANRNGAAAGPAGLPPVAAAGEAAIQRQLKTLDEINRLNEMNRQLMDQQRRVQNQR